MHRAVIFLFSAMIVGTMAFFLLNVSTQAAPIQAGGAGGKTVWDDVYSADQAARGETEYQKACSSCHGADLMGAVPGAGGSGGGNAPILANDLFIDRWRGDNLVALFTFIKGSMPRRAETSLTDATKIDILAFILKENGFPAGTEELRADALARIQLVGKEGPKPLPSTTPVRTVGCLTRGAGDAWMLSEAPEPVRTHRPDETTPEELESSKAWPLGTLAFRLPSLDFAIPGVRPSSYEGDKVQVKGIVYRRMTGDTINVRSLESIASSCPQ